MSNNSNPLSKEAKVILSITAAGAILLGGLVVNAKWYRPWSRNERRIAEVARGTGLPKQEVRGIYHQGMPAFNIGDLYKKGGLETILLLQKDPEIMEENSYWAGKPIRYADDIQDVMLNPNFDPNEYCKWRSKNLGVYTMNEARGYGLTLDEFLSTPFKMRREDIQSLQRERIPADYALPFLQDGKYPKQIAEEYAKEKIGVSAKERRAFYSTIDGETHKPILDESEMKKLAQKKISAGGFKALIYEVNLTKAEVFEMIDQGLLDGDVFVSWTGLTESEMIFGIQHNYSPEDALEAKRLGRTLSDVHRDIPYRIFLNGIIERSQAGEPLLVK